MKQIFTGNWRKEPTHMTIKRLAKKHNMPWIRARMAHLRSRNLQEMLFADLAGKIMEDVTYLDKGQLRPYKKECGCNKDTLVNSKCIFDEFPQKCRTRDTTYRLIFTPTGCFYDGKASVPIKKRILTQHLGDTQQAFRRREKFQKEMKELVKKSQITKRRGRKPLKEITNETDQQERSDDKEGKTKTPKTEQELAEQIKKLNWSEATRYLWKRALEQEKKQGYQFKTTGKMKEWLRKNIKVEMLYKQTVTSKMKTAGTKKCGLCTAERRII